MFLFKNNHVKAALYVPNWTYEIKDEGYFSFDSIQHQNKQFQISDYKYLIWKRQVDSDKSLVFFLIHDSEEDGSKWKLFLQKYQEINEEMKIMNFLDIFQLHNIRQNLTLDLQQLESDNQIFSTDFHPYITAIPARTKIIDINKYSKEEIIKNISSKFFYSFDISNDKLELKNRHAIILSDKSIIDNDQKFIVKKGIEYSVEFLNKESIWINLSYTNFSRTTKSIIHLKIQEPIDHHQHKLINIKTGRHLSKKIKYISDINSEDTNFIFETFNSEKAFQEICHNTRFSSQKFYFEQTNLEKTINLIEELNKYVTQSKNFNFSEINNIKYKYKIIHKKRKYLFGNGQLHHTPGKGLHHSGVYRMPEQFKVKILVSREIAETESLSKIHNNVNDRIKFLYNKTISCISEEDIIIFNYHGFNEKLLKDKLEQEKQNCGYIVHLINSNEKEKINTKIIEILKVNRQIKFSIINTLEEHTLANCLLNLGLSNKAIPWKIDCIDNDDKNHIFVGIDLGHDNQNRFSNLSLTAIDNHGCLLNKYQRNQLQLNEAIPYSELIKGFKKILHTFLNQDISITIHRDGIYQENIDDYHRIMEELGIEKYNLIEVTKSGIPLIGFYSISEGKTNYLDGFSGYYVFIKDTTNISLQSKDISYLITNDQCLKTRTAPSPLKIKKIYGYKEITRITEEIYWLTKAYSVNIFEPTKLPITTHLANNWSYTKNLIHFTTE